jgi:hypothetical protein
MRNTDIFQGFAASEVLEKTTLTTVADVAKATATTTMTAKSLKVYGKSKDGTERGYWIYHKVGGTGIDPTLGWKTVDALTFRLDTAGDMASKYFTLYNGTSTSQVLYYVPFTVAGVGFDPKYGQKETTRIKLVADTAGNKTGTYWNLYGGPATQHYIWYDKNGAATDPNPGSIGKDRGVRVLYNPGDTAEVLAEKTTLAMRNNGTNAAHWTVTHAHTSDSVAQVCTVATVADVSGSLNNKFFTFGVPGAALTDWVTQTKYCVWINVNSAGTDPKLPGYTSVPVAVATNATAAAVGTAIAAAIGGLTGTGAAGTTTVTITNTYKGKCDLAADGIKSDRKPSTGFTFAVSATGSDPSIMITNNDGGLATDASDGTTGVTATVVTQGTAAVAGLSTATKLCTVDVASGAADEVVAAAFVTAINKVWAGSAVARAPANDHIVDLTHPSYGNCTTTADGNIGGAFAVSATAGTDPTTGTAVGQFTPICVAYASDTGANDIATAYRAAVNAVTNDPVNRPADFSLQATGSTNSVVLENRWGGQTVSQYVDVASGLTPTRTTTGTAVLTTNAGTTTNSYVIKPDVDEVVFLATLTLSMSDTAVTTGTSFGALAGLTSGFQVDIMDKDGTVIKNLIPATKTNAQFLALGYGTSLGSTYLQVVDSLVNALGGAMSNTEVPIAGKSGQYLRFYCPDNMTGLDGFYLYAQGHYQ